MFNHLPEDGLATRKLAADRAAFAPLQGFVVMRVLVAEPASCGDIPDALDVLLGDKREVESLNLGNYLWRWRSTGQAVFAISAEFATYASANTS
jgi:hypothetical protein